MQKLESSVERDLLWRKREISHIYLQIQAAEGDIQIALLRAALVMLYAHWEGFIKNTTEQYINFINRQGLVCKRIKYNFAILLFKKQLEDIANTNKHAFACNVYKKIVEEQNICIKMHENIDTKSNLNKNVFEDIFFLINAKVEKYENKFKIIDSLVDDRNHIAHGRQVNIQIEKYKNICDNMLDTMDIYKNDIIDMCINRAFEIEEDFS